MEEKRRQEAELEKDCVRAFTSGNKLMAEQLLTRIPLPAVRAVTTTFKLLGVCSMVTLLHVHTGAGKCSYCATVPAVTISAAVGQQQRSSY